MPIRKSNSEAIILLAVAAASPGTIKVEGMYIMLKAPVIVISRYSNPAIFAVFLVEFKSLLLVFIIAARINYDATTGDDN